MIQYHFEALPLQIFQALDTNQDGRLSLVELVLGLSSTSSASPEERLRWTFRLYDASGDGLLEYQEVRSSEDKVSAGVMIGLPKRAFFRTAFLYIKMNFHTFPINFPYILCEFMQQKSILITNKRIFTFHNAHWSNTH